MPIDLNKIREENSDIWGESSLREVANDLYTFNPDFQRAYASVDEWADREGLREEWDADDARIAKVKERSLQQAQIQDRGLLGQAASTVARGIYGGAELGLRAARRTLGQDPERDQDTLLSRGIQGMEEYREETPFLQARQTETGLGRSVQQGAESAVQSLTPALAGAAAGAAIGSAFGGIGALPGAAIGFVAGAPLFGLGTWDDALQRGFESERYKSGQISREDVEEAAFKIGLAEGGIEFVSNMLEVATAGGAKLLTTPAKSALKASIK